MSDLRRCARCALPETHETIVFDERGVCNVCQQQAMKQTLIDWDAKKKQLDNLIELYRGRYDYDCVVPFSGGKDSTWTLYYLMKEYKLKPLAVRFDHGFLRPNVIENTNRTMRALGVELHQFTPNWKVVRQVMLQSFLTKGDFCWHCHTGIFAYPMWVALRNNVPLVIWGEPSAEYTAYYGYDQTEEVDETRFNRFINLGITAGDMFIRLEGRVDERDLRMFSYPPQRELSKIGYHSVCLGSYVPWDVKSQVEIIQRELGWKGDEVENVPSGYGYEKIECYMQGVRDYIKYIKRGYSRATHLASIDIRNNRLDRAVAFRIIGQHENRRPPSLDLFLDYVGLTEEQFMEIALSHGVSPYRHDQTATLPGVKTSDFGRWPRDREGLPRAEAEHQLDRWKKQQSEKNAAITASELA